MTYLFRLTCKSTLLLFFFIGAVFSTYVSADELSHGTFNIDNGGDVIQAPLLSTDVKMNISGLMARVEVTQTFKNESPNWVEGKYLFPLPEKSAVDSLQMKIGERIIIGEIKEKQQAKKIYERAKISGRKASLVAQHRPNVFTNSVANIAPFETIEVKIEYQQDLMFRLDEGISIRFPMTMTPRYTPSNIISESYQDLSQGFMVSPSFFSVLDYSQVSAEKSSHRVSIEANIDSGFPLSHIESKSHKVVYNQQSESLHKIKLSGFDVKNDRDFILNWKPVDGAAPRAALFTETQQSNNFLSLMILPPAAGTQPISLSREVIFVIDTSGSMAGESIQQAKSALLYGFDSLTPNDYFNVIEFNSTTSRLFNHSRPFTLSSKKLAERFVANLNAQGGTEMYSAMDAALKSTGSNTDLRQVVFLTDGAISNEAQLFQLIEDKLGDSRLFTVGIGSAPNAFFMKRAARFGRGSFTFVADVQQAESIITELFSKIASPVLSNIAIDWPAGTQVEMWPSKIPDLYAGEPLWIKAKTSSLNGNLAISGQLANSLWQTDVRLSSNFNQPGVAKLWAREKIASLMNQARHGRLSAEAKKAVTDVALEHQLVSRYTSLIAVDKTPSRVAEELYSKRIQQTRPKGSVAPMSYPKTALPFYVSSKYAFIILLISFFSLVVLKVRENR